MKTSLLSSFFVLSSLWQVANSIYPDCVPVACRSLQQTVKTSCGYDISQTTNATGDQTDCICGISNVIEPLQTCFNCLEEDTNKENADYFAGICPALSVTRTGATTTSTTSTDVGVSSAPSITPTPTGATATGVTSTPLTTDTSDSTSTGTDTATDTDTDSSSTGNDPTVLVDLEPTSTSTGAAGHYTPVFGLAAIMLMAQVGL